MSIGLVSAYLPLPHIGTVYATREALALGSAFIERFDDGAGIFVFIGKWRFVFDKGQRPAWMPALMALAVAAAMASAAGAGIVWGIKRLCAVAVGQRFRAEGEGQP
ncbi:hypothetical protein RNI52_34490 [Labrys neptuniae]|uniref:hypothetical protein n=1 Tax=Labrys neptuniae TaxID=376174 RepID=UPI002891A7A5|nr:hypothetical protein [Labrys neptuniae]MDT3382486.1 hypothetical protein [Labrys neptuniae]